MLILAYYDIKFIPCFQIPGNVEIHPKYLIYSKKQHIFLIVYELTGGTNEVVMYWENTNPQLANSKVNTVKGQYNIWHCCCNINCERHCCTGFLQSISFWLLSQIKGPTCSFVLSSLFLNIICFI